MGITFAISQFAAWRSFFILFL